MLNGLKEKVDVRWAAPMAIAFANLPSYAFAAAPGTTNSTLNGILGNVAGIAGAIVAIIMIVMIVKDVAGFIGGNGQSSGSTGEMIKHVVILFLAIGLIFAAANIDAFIAPFQNAAESATTTAGNVANDALA